MPGTIQRADTILSGAVALKSNHAYFCVAKKQAKCTGRQWRQKLKTALLLTRFEFTSYTCLGCLKNNVAIICAAISLFVCLDSLRILCFLIKTDLLLALCCYYCIVIHNIYCQFVNCLHPVDDPI